MWLRICSRLRRAWPSVFHWKRVVVTSVSVCVIIQIWFGWTLWHEARIRERFAGKAKLLLGKSMLPPTLESSLSRFVTPDMLALLHPIEMVSIQHPTTDDLRLLSRLKYIKHLSIHSGKLSEPQLRQIGLLSQLEELHLESECTDPKLLAALPECAKLRRLRIEGEVLPETLEPLRHSVALRSLHLSTDFDEPITGGHLAVVARIPNLKRLVIESHAISTTDLNRLAESQCLEELFVQELFVYTAPPQDGPLIELGRIPRLKLLSLNFDAVRYIEPLEGFPALTTLALHKTAISPNFLWSLRQLPCLDTLSLERCLVNDSLSALAENSKLERLNLEASDANVEGIRRIGRLEALEMLAMPGVQDPGEFRDLFPRLRTISKFSWDTSVERDAWTGSFGSGTGFF
ncbi:MAG: uncharacterized protein JWP89_2416 [Schlesneria sp.]|nr:uncharacterized protein [Schlesneria sp.]